MTEPRFNDFIERRRENKRFCREVTSLRSQLKKTLEKLPPLVEEPWIEKEEDFLSVYGAVAGLVRQKDGIVPEVLIKRVEYNHPLLERNIFFNPTSKKFFINKFSPITSTGSVFSQGRGVIHFPAKVMRPSELACSLYQQIMVLDNSRSLPFHRALREDSSLETMLAARKYYGGAALADAVKGMLPLSELYPGGLRVAVYELDTALAALLGKNSLSRVEREESSFKGMYNPVKGLGAAITALSDRNQADEALRDALTVENHS